MNKKLIDFAIRKVGLGLVSQRFLHQTKWSFPGKCRLDIMDAFPDMLALLQPGLNRRIWQVKIFYYIGKRILLCLVCHNNQHLHYSSNLLMRPVDTSISSWENAMGIKINRTTWIQSWCLIKSTSDILKRNFVLRRYDSRPFRAQHFTKSKFKPSGQ